MFKHILIPTDGSKLSNASAAAAVWLAKRVGARVTAFFAAAAGVLMLLSAGLSMLWFSRIL